VFLLYLLFHLFAHLVALASSVVVVVVVVVCRRLSSISRQKLDSTPHSTARASDDATPRPRVERTHETHDTRALVVILRPSVPFARRPSSREDDMSGIKVKTARDIALKAAEIFGHHVGNGLPSGRKVLRKPMIGDALVAYYPKSLARSDPLFTAPDETRRKVKLERLRRRGKGPPKKGEGKRASK